MSYLDQVKIIPVDLKVVKADVELWLKDIERSTIAFVKRVEEDRSLAIVQQKKDLIADWIALDMKKANLKTKRLKSKKASDEEIKRQERHCRHLRATCWDLEDIIIAHLGQEKLEVLIENYRVDFPMACGEAIGYLQEL